MIDEPGEIGWLRQQVHCRVERCRLLVRQTKDFLEAKRLAAERLAAERQGPGIVWADQFHSVGGDPRTVIMPQAERARDATKSA